MLPNLLLCFCHIILKACIPAFQSLLLVPPILIFIVDVNVCKYAVSGFFVSSNFLVRDSVAVCSLHVSEQDFNVVYKLKIVGR
jgi:hypothetical protein